MITFDTAQNEQSVVGLAWLVELYFGTGTVRYTTAPVPITVGADTYTGYGALVGVSNVAESEELVADQVRLSMSIVDQALIAASLGNVENYRGKAVKIRLQLLTEHFVPAGTPRLRWSGVMDRVEIKRDGDGSGAAGGSIEMICTRSGVARMRRAKGLRLTHEQQQRRFPGDTGVRFVRELIGAPQPWLTKRFQQQ